MKALVIISICVIVLICSGYFVHICNSKYAPTWGEGIARVLVMILEIMLSVPYCIIKFLPSLLFAIFKFITEVKKFSTGEDVLEMLADQTRMLTNEEVLELVESFHMHPYDTPSLISYTPNINGVAWYSIEALRLTDAYSTLTNAELSKMCYHKIRNYIMETRGIQVPIYIKVATPTQLYFAIPLSAYGEKLLSKQSQETTPVSKVNNAPVLKEEVIDIFEDLDGDKK